MAEKKKKQTAEFAKDKNAFASGVSAKKNSVENKEKQKQSGAHQPRDADTTSGHNVQKFKQPESANGSVKQNVSKQKDRPDSAGVRDNRSGFQGETWKNTGQKAKSSQKKRRQPGKFRKENSLTGQKEKPDSNNADSNMAVLHGLMRNPVEGESIEFNDNRLSLYSAQKGKCAVTGNQMDMDEVVCIRKIPKEQGGTDKYSNLLLVCRKVQELLHIGDTDTFIVEMGKLNLDTKRSEKLLKLRSLAFVESC